MSPVFPGMDPYLEGSDAWQAFHGRFVTYIADDLQARLPDPYVATIEVREYVEWMGELNAELKPHVPSLTRPSAMIEAREMSAVSDGDGYWVPGTSVERREAAVAIRTREQNEVVTWIELLSPSNKRPGAGRVRYQRKQLEVLAAEWNLVELDLLRGGSHTVAVDAAWLRPDQPRDCIACKHLSTRPGWFWVRQWSLRDPLPMIEIPLAAGESALPLELGELFMRAYEDGGFRKLLPYEREPEPPLSSAEAEWAADLLSAADLKGKAGA